MDFGFILLLAGIITLIIDLILIILKNRYENIKNYLTITLTISSLLIISSYLIFLGSFIFLDFSYDYVYKHASSNMDIFFRLASTWSGQAGSYFIWAMYVFSINLILRILFRKHIENPLYQRMFIVISLNSIALLLLTLINNPYIDVLTANSQFTSIPVDGLGLSPVLNTYWNVIHPPIVLLSYALFLIPFAISISRYSLGEPEYHTTTEIIPLRRFTMVLAWFIITIGLALGGYWAYVTLGWGGFWAWDPVETSSLVPWIFATIYFHNSPGNKEKATNYDKDNFAILPFLTVIFATLITRSGIIESVHTFGSSPLSIGLFIYFLALFFGVVLVYVRSGNLQLFHSWEYVKKMNIQEIALYITYISLLLGAIGILFGLVIPFGMAILPVPFNQSLIVDQKFFNMIIGIFGFFALASTLFMDFMYPKLTKNKISILVGTI
ncbi:MAG: Cytochrome c-type biogenesis protein CcmF, partial [Candidatus Heimdallarchaeota archaeon LC_3]